MSAIRARKAISPLVVRELWFLAGGRCEYRACNRLLSRDSITKGKINKAYISHIIAARPKGPRGDKVLSKQLEISLENLMLLCDECHNRIDKAEVENHPKDFLLEMKKEHEERIELVTGINFDKDTHIVIYKSSIGEHTPSITHQEANACVIPNYYPAEVNPIDLSIGNNLLNNGSDSYWINEVRNLELQFEKKIYPKILRNEIRHISIFAFAPMPLLIKLGTLINDIHKAEIHQPIRTPFSWNLDTGGTGEDYIIMSPKEKYKKVALNISLSADVNDERITDVLGLSTSIYRLTIQEPFNDYLRTKRSLDNFSIAIRKLFNQIKKECNAQTPLHIFPSMPIATAIELGRSWMPKADMPLIIYDENKSRTGFYKTIEIDK
jgi:hypothetical protein